MQLSVILCVYVVFICCRMLRAMTRTSKPRACPGNGLPGLAILLHAVLDQSCSAGLAEVCAKHISQKVLTSLNTTSGDKFAWITD